MLEAFTVLSEFVTAARVAPIRKMPGAAGAMDTVAAVPARLLAVTVTEADPAGISKGNWPLICLGLT